VEPGSVRYNDLDLDRPGLPAGAEGAVQLDAGRRAELGVDLRQMRADRAVGAEFTADLWRGYLGTANTELIEYARRLRPPTASKT
jgi:hypothetical protein